MNRCFDCGTYTDQETCPCCGSEDIRNYEDYYDEVNEDE